MPIPRRASVPAPMAPSNAAPIASPAALTASPSSISTRAPAPMLSRIALMIRHPAPAMPNAVSPSVLVVFVAGANSRNKPIAVEAIARIYSTITTTAEGVATYARHRKFASVVSADAPPMDRRALIGPNAVQPIAIRSTSAQTVQLPWENCQKRCVVRDSASTPTTSEITTTIVVPATTTAPGVSTASTSLASDINANCQAVSRTDGRVRVRMDSHRFDKGLDSKRFDSGTRNRAAAPNRRNVIGCRSRLN